MCVVGGEEMAFEREEIMGAWKEREVWVTSLHSCP